MKPKNSTPVFSEATVFGDLPKSIRDKVIEKALPSPAGGSFWPYNHEAFDRGSMAARDWIPSAKLKTIENLAESDGCPPITFQYFTGGLDEESEVTHLSETFIAVIVQGLLGLDAWPVASLENVSFEAGFYSFLHDAYLEFENHIVIEPAIESGCQRCGGYEGETKAVLKKNLVTSPQWAGWFCHDCIAELKEIQKQIAMAPVPLHSTPRTTEDQVLSGEALGRFLAALDSLGSSIATQALRATLFNGQLNGPFLIRKLLWENVDLQAGTALLPHPITGDTQSITINRPFNKILREMLKDRKPDCPWVFPSASGDNHLHIDLMEEVFYETCEKAGFEDLCLNYLELPILLRKGLSIESLTFRGMWIYGR